MVHLRLREKSLRLFQTLCCLLPIDNKKIYIDCFSGRGFNCNPKYIAIALHKKDKRLKFIWHTSGNRKTAPKWITEISGEYRRIYERATSRVWIDNARKDKSEKKRRGQYYIQTWHGMIALKRIERDVEDKLPADYVESAKHDSSMIDMFLSNGSLMTNMIRQSMWYKGNIFECGTPRMDVMVNPNESTHRVRSHFGLSERDILVLYAPTFRQNSDYEYSLNLDRLLCVLKHRFGADAKLLVRLHPNIQEKYECFNYSESIINASLFPDMNELMSECDLMVNDYSSSMFEFGYVKKPVFLYMNDLKEYQADRGFYFNINELPFPISYDEEGLFRSIMEFDIEKYRKDVEKFFTKHNIIETGHASEDVANKILSIIYAK